jgi:twitching motility protein PilT
MAAPPESIELYCRAAKEYKASDLLLHAGESPILKISGSMTSLDTPAITATDLLDFRRACEVPESSNDHDTSFISKEGIRFRVNFLRQLGCDAAVLRRISENPPEIDQLGVPSDILKDWALRRSGIVIISGPTGSGKSTTLAALLEWINQNHERHVVTIEDPVEFVFHRNKAIFTQRGVGQDTASFAEGLRRSLRQAPDIILVGEIRDAETASVALQAAETGHLVFTTLHASDVGEVIERMIAFFPEAERIGHLQVLAGQLHGVLCQKLLPSVDGGMVLACEYMSNIGRTRQCVLQGDIPTLREHLSISHESESCDFLRILEQLVDQGRLSVENALLSASNPAELRRRLRGISSNFSEKSES